MDVQSVSCWDWSPYKVAFCWWKGVLLACTAGPGLISPGPFRDLFIQCILSPGKPAEGSTEALWDAGLSVGTSNPHGRVAGGRQESSPGAGGLQTPGQTWV